MVKYFFPHILFAALLTSVSTLGVAATLTATPDRTVISEDETVQLTVSIDEQVGFDGPNFQVLESHFEILNQHRSAQFRSANGRTQGWTEWTVVLAPVTTGKIVIPSFTVEGAMSDPVEITVNKAAPPKPGEVRELYTEMEVSKDNIYVQEQLLVTYRIFAAAQVREIKLAQSFAVADANVELAAESHFRKTINNQVYRAYEVVYAVHPQKSGELQIPELTWNLVTAGSIASWYNDPQRSSRGRVRRMRTEARTITVKPIPNNYAGVDWIPARLVTLEQHWSTSPNRFVVGEPITRTLTLTATGLTPSQLPSIPQTDSDKINVYEDQPQFDQSKSREGVTGVRIETTAIVPTEAGNFTLPPVAVSWWDTVDNVERQAELPSQNISVAPAAMVNNGVDTGANPVSEIPTLPNTNPAQTFTDNPLGRSMNWAEWKAYWPLLASNGIFAVLTLILLAAWLSARRSPIPVDPEVRADEQHQVTLKQLLQNVRKACAENQAVQCKQALAQWGKAYFQLPHLASLQELSHLCGCPKISAELESLDKMLYGKQPTLKWQGRALWSALYEFQKSHTTGNGSQSSQVGTLKPLYPTH